MRRIQEKDSVMDPKIVAMRLQKLDNYVRHLHDLKQAPLDESE